MHGYEHYSNEEGDETFDPELGLEVMRELEEERGLKSIIRGRLLDSLAAKGVDVTDIQREAPNTDMLQPEAQEAPKGSAPQDLTEHHWHLIDLESAVVMMTDAVRAYEMHKPTINKPSEVAKDIYVRAVDDIVTLKYHAQMTIEEELRVSLDAKRALIMVLEEEIPTDPNIIPVEYEQRIKEQLREDLRKFPGKPDL